MGILRYCPQGRFPGGWPLLGLRGVMGVLPLDSLLYRGGGVLVDVGVGGGHRFALVMYTLLVTIRLSDVKLQACLDCVPDQGGRAFSIVCL